ncbi:YebC/PmpR family DNA-binding transcriptional regulator [bacterium]|nr:YebC/PmpR family DNA-binding transcriptional regulator [bacterium]MCG2677714.1 YebC/PmpR family DNA-binding transcriptional regulator [bacterium]
MSGHSKWAGIKHKKAIVDAKKGKIFSKLIREITVAARSGGGDLTANARLRQAMDRAKEANMPSDNIKRAIQKGTGELPGVSYEEIIYEGYGPGGVAVLLNILTDNKNRTTSEVRHLFERNGGHLGGAGSVAWVFEKRGLITVDGDKCKEDELMEVVLEAGAEDLKKEGNTFEIITSLSDFEKVKKTIKEKGIEYNLAEVTMIPKEVRKLDVQLGKQLLRLIDTLEEHDDVQHVYANFDIPDEVIEEMEKE